MADETAPAGRVRYTFDVPADRAAGVDAAFAATYPLTLPGGRSEPTPADLHAHTMRCIQRHYVAEIVNAWLKERELAAARTAVEAAARAAVDDTTATTVLTAEEIAPDA